MASQSEPGLSVRARMYAGTLSSRTSTNLSRSCWKVPDGGIVVAGTRDSFEMITLMNLAVDFESTALENAAGELINGSGHLCAIRTPQTHQ